MIIVLCCVWSMHSRNDRAIDKKKRAVLGQRENKCIIYDEILVLLKSRYKKN